MDLDLSERVRKVPAASDDIPLLLRHSPAIGVSAITLLVGTAMLVGAASVNSDHPFASGVLVNTGSSVILFAPLALLGAFFGRKLVHSQAARDSRITELSTRVEDIKRDVDSVLDEVTTQSLKRIAADRENEELDIVSILASPGSAGIASAVRFGMERGYLSHRGPRVRIRGTDVYVRWTPSEDRDDALQVVLETIGGKKVKTVDWTAKQPADDFGYRLARALQETDAYPGDIGFDVGGLFRSLHELVNLGYRRETGAGGVVDPIGPLIELMGDKWALTDYWIVTREWHSYQITLDRLDQMDWDEHIRQKYDMDIVGFRLAFDTAKELVASGELSIPNYDEGFITRPVV